MTQTTTQPNQLRLMVAQSTPSTSRRVAFPDDEKLISFIIPVMDEEMTLTRLYRGISDNVPEEYDFEVLFIDDGSQDGSWEVIEALAEVYPDNVRGLKFRSNRGKATALTVGYEEARGDIVFTMDADLQDDPQEIPRFIDKLQEGYGLVSGWKKKRHDPWHKVWPSRIFNAMLSYFSGVKLHDHNCGFKCYDAGLAKQLRLHGELHRMVPALAAMRGFKVTEIVVTHHAREHGQSKYGIERFLRGFSDMLTIGFQRRFRERPSHFINGISLAYFVVSTLLGLIGVLQTLSGGTPAVCTMLLLGTLLFAALGLATFVAGQIAELIVQKSLNQTTSQLVVDDTVSTSREIESNQPELLGQVG